MLAPYGYTTGVHTTYVKGETAQLHVQLRANALGFVVSRPTVEARYDLIVDESGKLLRGQVKYADRIVDGAIRLDLRKQTRNRGPRKRYTDTEIDVLFVYVPSMDAVLRLPVELVHNKSTLSLRVEPAGRGQTKGVMYAVDYVW